MEASKHNIRQVIEDFLKSNHVRYTIHDENYLGLTYELYLGSLGCYLQVEYNLEDDSDEFVVVQLYTDVNERDESIYHSEWDNEKEGDGIQEEIENLIQGTKRLNSVINNIRKHIDKIKEICEENELNIEAFITSNFDFDR